MTKGEVFQHEQFILSPQCFLLQRRQKVSVCGKGGLKNMHLVADCWLQAGVLDNLQNFLYRLHWKGLSLLKAIDKVSDKLVCAYTDIVQLGEYS